MSTEAEDLHRIISASLRDMLDAYRIQESVGPVTDQALEQILLSVDNISPLRRPPPAAVAPLVAPGPVT